MSEFLKLHLCQSAYYDYLPMFNTKIHDKMIVNYG